MLSRSLTTSIPEQVEDSDGASALSCIGDWDHRNWTAIPLRIELMTSDLGTFGNATLRTIVEMTGDIIGQPPADAISRIVCFYILSRLNGEPLKEACQVL